MKAVFIIFLFLVFAGCSQDQLSPPEDYTPNFEFSTYNILLDGDSRTDGWNCKTLIPYQDFLRFGDSIHINKVSYGGATTWELNHRSENVYFSRLSGNSKNLLVIWSGVNDMLVHNADAEKVFSEISQYCSSRKSEGWSLIVCTEISMKASYDSVVHDEERLKLNMMIRNQWSEMADGIADLGMSQLIGYLGAYHDTTYFCDGVHLTRAGTEEVASIVERAIKSYLRIPIAD